MQKQIEKRMPKQMSKQMYEQVQVHKTTQRIAYCAMLIALAMIFSYVESLIPFNFGVPGMKLGIANLVMVTGLYFLPFTDVCIISLVRIVLVGSMFGNGMSIIYSLAGGVLSLIVMMLLKQMKGFSIVGVSIAGGISHNIGQLIVAAIVVQNIKILYYCPTLLIAGTITGTLIGIVSGQVLAAIKKMGMKLQK